MKNRTKIVATIGPASITQQVLSEMMKNGLDVCRLNFSHGNEEGNRRAIKNIRTVATKNKRDIGIMADIQGPRIRVVNERALEVRAGEKIYLTDKSGPDKKSYRKKLVLDWNEFYYWVHPGDIIYIEDGLIQLKIVKNHRYGCVAKVLVAGIIKQHKGVNIPAISAHLGFLTEKDLADLKFILAHKVDFIAVSFVASAKDILSLRTIIQHFQEELFGEDHQVDMPWIISKIERQKAIKNIKEIIKVSDGIMVARGDLAIETPQEKVAILQKDIIKKCLKNKKPVIVATQMMASMVSSARPTRAEISDVTNAVIDGTDAVMLSNETAVGQYPEETIKIMDKIIKEVELSVYNDQALISRNKFARVLMRYRRGRRRTLKVSSLEELKSFSFLRQEKIKLILVDKNKANKRKASLIWGAE